MSGRPLPRAGTSLPILALILLGLALPMAVLLAGCGSGAKTTTSGPTLPPVTSTTDANPTAAATLTTTTPAQTAAFPVTVTDDDKKTVTISKEPTRIVSTAPSNTEILFALGLGPRVVGVSSTDDYPPAVKALAKVGSFLEVNNELVMARSPDLVLGTHGDEEALAPIAKTGIPALYLEPSSVEGIYASIDTIGQATGATARATALVASLKAQMKAVADVAAKTGTSPTVFYALDNTLWTVGPGSLEDELIRLAHGTNVADENAGPATKAYFQLAAEQLVALNPDVILLANTAYKSAQEFTSDPRFASLKAVKDGQVLVINDVIITRPGPRIAEGLKVLATALHPGAF